MQLCLGFLVIEPGELKELVPPEPIEGADLPFELPPLPTITWHLVGLSHFKKAMQELGENR